MTKLPKTISGLCVYSRAHSDRSKERVFVKTILGEARWKWAVIDWKNTEVSASEHTELTFELCRGVGIGVRLVVLMLKDAFRFVSALSHCLLSSLVCHQT